jgi:hypothetical protein
MRSRACQIKPEANPAFRQGPIDLAGKTAACALPDPEPLHPKETPVEGVHLDFEPLSRVVPRPLRPDEQSVWRDVFLYLIQKRDWGSIWRLPPVAGGNHFFSTYDQEA